MVYQFQIEVAPGEWLNFASAEGSGLHPAGAAISDLWKANGEMLDAGRYRYRPEDGGSDDWFCLTLHSAWRASSKPAIAA
jgi:hypothetical protein